MVQESTCAHFRLLVHQAVHVASRACSFVSKKHNPRDDFKHSGEPPRDSTTTLNGSACVADENGSPAGSDDEDVLTSLGASYRAWQVYHREKRAHDYTKTRLVDSIKRENELTKQMARVGGSVEGIERTLMGLEDLETAVATSNELLLGAGVTRKAADKDAECTLESPCQMHLDRVHEAESAVLHWKTQYEKVLPELAACHLERDRLVGELRMAKKTAVLMMNRQIGQLEALNSTHHQSLPRIPRHRRIDVKKRSYSDVVI
ncbi:unnamed protein product [Hyaloperonospora brassicae]|uniref:Tektin n=1 Tax=Hyaloperonospora brassicae TaxID=162125 RepID=A0AAV0UN38_HYABA|nr:unnamed protein product [Hyaloperonospora brassicae]